MNDRKGEGTMGNEAAHNRTAEVATKKDDLRKRLDETRATIRRLEESQVVSPETMRLEVSI